MKTEMAMVGVVAIALLSGCKSPQPARTTGQPDVKPLPTTVYLSTIHTSATFRVSLPARLGQDFGDTCEAFAKQKDADPQALIMADNLTPVSHVYSLYDWIRSKGLTNISATVYIWRTVPIQKVTFEPMSFDGIRRPKPRLTIIKSPEEMKSVQPDASSLFP